MKTEAIEFRKHGDNFSLVCKDLLALNFDNEYSKSAAGLDRGKSRSIPTQAPTLG